MAKHWSDLIEEVGCWECTTCGGEQNYSRDYCHNCFEGKRPAMTSTQRRKVKQIWAGWTESVNARAGA
jgi:hypothetical protein